MHRAAPGRANARLLEAGVGRRLGLLGNEQPGAGEVEVKRCGHRRRRQQGGRRRDGRGAGEIAGAAVVAVLQSAWLMVRLGM